MIARTLNQLISKEKKSILVLGPRQTGKSTLLLNLKPDLTINLADEEVYLAFAAHPGELRSRLNALRQPKSTIFIDEVQRIPTILNTVQALIDEKHQLRFILSGSSARKLKRGHANLLPGRIHSYELGPITSREYYYQLNSYEVLARGTLPAMLTEEDPRIAEKTLRTYGATYLKEEIQAEALSRNLEGFARFLCVVGSWSGNLVDYTKVASRASLSRQTVTRYFEILSDTLVFHRLESFARSSRLKLIQHPKFYAFDVGVLNGLLENFIVSADRRGHLFETLILAQLHASLVALDKSARVSFFLTESGAEVDFIVEFQDRVLCIEVKSSETLAQVDTRGFESFESFYGGKCERFIFYLGTSVKEIDGVRIFPWQEGLREIGL